VTAPVAIVNIGMGNLRSVACALKVVGVDALMAERPEQLREADRIVLPGVGAFGEAMSRLRQRGWIETLEREVRAERKPFLGICLGMQLLATTGTEHGTHEGLGWIEGVAKRFPEAPALRIPHMGWNDVAVTAAGPLLDGIGPTPHFYFVHSYYLEPRDPGVVAATCDYGIPFAAAVQAGNVWATQFHPEKSQKTGQAILRNFLRQGRTTC
jgi:imidazole glycerol-phosphate synthase subunit HisH